jgi:hypothetical protein
MNSSFTKSTDSKHKIKLDSNLIYVLWRSKYAYGGADAEFEVRTSLVGDGAEVKVKGKTGKGKSIGSADGKIYGNRYVGAISIPDKIDPEDEAYIEVRLPKHGLSGESNRIPARPRPAVKLMKWDRSVVRRNDTVTITCEFESGVIDGDPARILIREHNTGGVDISVADIPVTISNRKIELKWLFDHSDPTELIPAEPELTPHGKHYGPPKYYFIVLLDEIKIGTGRESGLMEFKDTASITLVALPDIPLANVNFHLNLADGKQIKGKTGADGVALIKDIPPGKAEIIVEGFDHAFVVDPLEGQS